MNIKRTLPVALCLLYLISFNSCEKEKKVPILSTVEASNISWTTAESGGIINSDNGFTITLKGVVWSTNPDPTIDDMSSNDGAGAGAYTSHLGGLLPNTTYYVRAYAQNSEGIGYGMAMSFKTDPTEASVIETSTVTSITTTSAVSGGNITSDGGSSITARGVCWNTSPNPTTVNFSTNEGSGTGTFNSTLTSLLPSTTYYVRAYATNSVGTSYGEQFVFSSSASDIEGNVYGAVIIGTQVWMKQNLRTTKFNDNTDITLVSDGPTWASLTTPGYCWFNNDETTYKAQHGALYNWNSVTTEKLCPDGWHVPTDADWVTLIDYLGGATVAGGKMKQVGFSTWTSPNMGATNESGFTALGTGLRFYLDGEFQKSETDTYFWSSTQSTTNAAWRVGLNYATTNALHSTSTKPHGFSIRCVKN